MNGEEPGYPILVLGAPRVEVRGRLGGGPGGARKPDHARQIERITPRFEILQRSFDERRAELQPGIAGAEPEQVLVFETVGTIEEFIKAVRHIEGMEFLGEFDEDDIPPDEDFYVESEPERLLSGTIYLVLTNQEAMAQLLGLWRRFRDDPDESFDRGLNRFRQLFRHLKEIRPWGPADRLEVTGIMDDWRHRAAEGQEVVPVEIELWYRTDPGQRAIAQAEVMEELNSVGGELITSAVVDEIRYHALLARLPVTTVENLFEAIDAIRLVRAEPVMFFRPVGQGVVVLGEAEGLPPIDMAEGDFDGVAPVVALLDGMPLEQHQALAGRLRVDDPDDVASRAQAARRRHGTAMASLIAHGDLSLDEPPLTSPIYVRPLLEPGPEWVSGAPETVPENQLIIDVILRAVRRMIEGEGEAEATAPTVRVINISIGDATPFSHMMSPWARLLDWISWRYRVLIVVSAGNHWDAVTLPIDLSMFRDSTEAELQSRALEALADQLVNRRLRPPSEAVNVVSVGASNEDGSALTPDGQNRELISSNQLPAPYSALGMGFRRAIKPDILAPGGRALYSPTEEEAGVRATPVVAVRTPPGQQVASPVGPAGTTAGIAYTSGTSNAAALVSRRAASLYEVLVQLRATPGAEFLDDPGVLTSALKALVVHGATMGDALSVISDLFTDRVGADKLREFTTRFVGYGAIGRLVAGSTEHRATMLGGGTLQEDEAHVYDIPLPPSLSGVTGERRLTMTLGWLTPTNPRDRRYRRAKLWLSPRDPYLGIRRVEADWRASQRGTIQHEVLTGTGAAAYTDGDVVSIGVNCMAHAGSLDVGVPYALAVSLEVAPELGVEVFAEVNTRIRPPVEVRPTP